MHLAALVLDANLNSHLMQLAVRFGLIGVLLVSIVDSSFVPLPIPGLSDVMCILFAAQHANPFALIAVCTFGSFLGGWFSYQVGQSGGLNFIEKRTPARIFKRVTGWMESHAILAVALPAILPPPMPLSPFVLAAGALKMSRNKFLITFTASRLLRHSFAVWLGIRFGDAVLTLWNKFFSRWGTPILIFLWVAILASVGYAFYQLWSTRKSLDKGACATPKTA